MAASSTIFKVFGMTRPGIKPRSPGPLANSLPTRQKDNIKKSKIIFVRTANNNIRNLNTDGKKPKRRKEIGGKTTVEIFQVTNERNLTREDLNTATKGIPIERTKISFNSCTKQRHKDQWYKSENQ